VANCQPWLRQGDVFEDIDWFRPIVTDEGLTVPRAHGAGLLITEGCQIDKRSGGRMKPDLRLTFLPVRGLESVENGNLRLSLLRGEDNVFDAIYIGDVEGDQVYGHLSEAFSIPASYFGAQTVDYSDHPGADPDDPHHLTLADNWVRLMTMDDAWLRVMHRKMWVYWTHLDLTEIDDAGITP
jgi:hypothetical protein